MIVKIVGEMKETTFLFISHQEKFTDMVNPSETTSLSSGELVI
jgi:hypothetical protein